MPTVSEQERKISDFIYNWFIKDPGLQSWKDRQELRDLVDYWCLLLDEENERISDNECAKLASEQIEDIEYVYR